MNRRSLLTGSIGLAGLDLVFAKAQAATPESLQDAPWLSGSSASHDAPVDAVADDGTVQVVRVSPVLHKEFAAILIHNATDRAVMLDGVRGVLSVETLPGYELKLGAYGIPSAILPPNEYWIGRLKVPAEIAVSTALTFESEVHLATELPRIRDISTLLTAIAPEDEFVLPQPDEPWPIRYRNDAPYMNAQTALFQQVFFAESGEICGFISADTRFDKSGEAEFLMQETSSPPTSTGGVPLGETSNRWLAQSSHRPWWTAFERFDFGE
jgi:hypothetical protein